MDKGGVTLLDLWADFDTIDHATLTNKLPDLYGISGQTKIFFLFENRHQSAIN